MFLKLEDVELFVSSFGKGPPTLIAHGGWVGSGELWSQPFEILSRSWRTITYDHRGTGATINHARRSHSKFSCRICSRFSMRCRSSRAF
jgi:pimeloyl-ACP methyl ester carboxylesterase